MLQVTETAASVFRKILDRDDVEGTAIRLVPEKQADGDTEIVVQTIDQPGPDDKPTQAEGVVVVVAAEIAPSLEDVVLDARETETGADLFVRSQ